MNSPSPITPSLVGQLINAIAFAAEKHKLQRRKDTEASPYINHPIGLVNVLINEGGIINNNVLCAAVLHDTIEDTNTTAKELSSHFGEKIASIVMEVTDDKTLPKAERKLQQIEQAALISQEAKLVKLADKICNLRDILKTPPKGWSVERKQEYFAWAQQVGNGLKGTHPQLENILDLLIINGSKLLSKKYSVVTHEGNYTPPNFGSLLPVGEFDTAEEAIVCLKQVIDKQLIGFLNDGHNAKNAYDQFSLYGEIPIIQGEPNVYLQPYEYAKNRVDELLIIGLLKKIQRSV